MQTESPTSPAHDGDATPGGAAARTVAAEAARRRTIAVISHPDAGKTTLTEHLLATAGAVTRAGHVKAKQGRAQTTTDWMAMERERGISVTSSAVRIQTGDTIVNLLDTPGHGDFSEDTYRVLAAVDAAVMLLDSAKGIEPQTRRLFEVCRARNTPIITFMNKFDRPSRDPLDLLHEVEQELDLVACPMTWPTGDSERFGGLVRLPSMQERVLDGAPRTPDDGQWLEAKETAELAWEAAGGYDDAAFRAGQLTPVIFGAAVRGWGVDDLLELIERHAPAPEPVAYDGDETRPVDAPFSGFVFKLQSNMDPRHRDISAFIRICSGRFERGIKTTLARTGRALILSQAHEPFGRERSTVEEAFPGDVIVLPGAGDLRIGDTIYDGPSVEFPRVRTFAPDLFAEVSNVDSGRRKQFQKGLQQLSGEGVVQLLTDPLVGVQRPVAAAAGELQFEVFQHRMRDEFGAEVRLHRLSYSASAQARREDEATIRAWRGVGVYHRPDGSPLAMFASPFSLSDHRRRFPEVQLSDVLD